MDSKLQKFFFLLGIGAALYLLFYYVLPFVFSVLAWVLKVVLVVGIIGAVLFVVVVAIGYVLRYTRDHKTKV